MTPRAAAFWVWVEIVCSVCDRTYAGGFKRIKLQNRTTPVATLKAMHANAVRAGWTIDADQEWCCKTCGPQGHKP